MCMKKKRKKKKKTKMPLLLTKVCENAINGEGLDLMRSAAFDSFSWHFLSKFLDFPVQELLFLRLTIFLFRSRTLDK